MLSLQPGDIIDVVAPGSACTPEVFQKSMSWLKAQGFVPRYPEDILKPEIFVAQSDEKRFQYLMDALKAKDSKAVWCLRGGYGSIRILDRLSKIKSLPRKKWLIGYSDITTLHQWLNQKMKWPTLHAPLLDRGGLGHFSEAEKNELLGVLTGSISEVYFDQLQPVNPSAELFLQKKKSLQSIVLGGNLTVYASSVGSLISPDKNKEHFLFLEDIGERGYRIDRLLYQLLNSGAFKKCRAVFLGDFIGGQESNGENHVQATLIHFFAKLKIPVFKGLSVGHGATQRTLILNSRAKLTCDQSARLVVFSS